MVHNSDRINSLHHVNKEINMTILTIKRPDRNKEDYEYYCIARTFYHLCPAFYESEKDLVTITKKILTPKFENHICDVIDHEYLHAILCELEGNITSHKLDNLNKELLEWM